MIRVADLMTTDLYTLRTTDSLRTARMAMTERRIRHVPVVDERNCFVGLVSQRDVLAASVSRLADIAPEERDAIESAIPVSEVMTTSVAAVDEDTPLLDAARYLLEHKYGCLPVLRGDRVVGIITETDFLRFVIHLLELEEAEALGEEV
ncbi:CBS domain-containing protein [Inmirania thermothiophila]|uniref:CBS domain-containing membrane protein n=1 Tax=Inmirania thermothiophila TaxID=1750597 RepID=A0A3N1Y1N0_9GAMM|nr:CBS domain-containing protein [Inmirania thermothiophila]ROR32736.1 CBS domain-containing membrane protein [Inmirania thermothiophila]